MEYLLLELQHLTGQDGVLVDSLPMEGSHANADSTATGNIGAILDEGFKYGGTEQLTISDLLLENLMF